MDKFLKMPMAKAMPVDYSRMPLTEAIPLDGIKLKAIDFIQLYPVFIAVFMVMSSLFNKDFKGIVWLGCAVIGVGLMHTISEFFTAPCPNKTPITNLLPKLIGVTNLSISSFFILFTLMYLVCPMAHYKDWNYYIILGFLCLYMTDIYVKLKLFCISSKGVFIGSVFGLAYGWICYMIMQSAGHKLLYFNTSVSNDVYCSRPKKQTFKCYVYKNGEIISSV
jgi:hypothetical protein